jgi:hypothetical protein
MGHSRGPPGAIGSPLWPFRDCWAHHVWSRDPSLPLGQRCLNCREKQEESVGEWFDMCVGSVWCYWLVPVHPGGEHAKGYGSTGGGSAGSTRGWGGRGVAWSPTRSVHSATSRGIVWERQIEWGWVGLGARGTGVGDGCAGGSCPHPPPIRSREHRASGTLAGAVDGVPVMSSDRSGGGWGAGIESRCMPRFDRRGRRAGVYSRPLWRAPGLALISSG